MKSGNDRRQLQSQNGSGPPCKNEHEACVNLPGRPERPSQTKDHGFFFSDNNQRTWLGISTYLPRVQKGLQLGPYRGSSLLSSPDLSYPAIASGIGSVMSWVSNPSTFSTPHGPTASYRGVAVCCLSKRRHRVECRKTIQSSEHASQGEGAVQCQASALLGTKDGRQS